MKQKEHFVGMIIFAINIALSCVIIGIGQDWIYWLGMIILPMVMLGFVIEGLEYSYGDYDE